MFDKNTNSALSAAVCPDQKTLRAEGFVTSTDTLIRALDPFSYKCIFILSICLS